ncbi:hypothetical protein GCM10010472_45280 [Pseudonocardia halophobica]|uniref:Uncharacterized protein n=1 Tax=Pseudonocardia halophobica TaxID=29401 RepID=A0A9W6P0M3_9PSEU|nr:hypothetical protein [Pseudonocardia halophobica]GLL15677.1 hypothetical protein GCM10017577_68300 [Pseudonocardia halophobica]
MLDPYQLTVHSLTLRQLASAEQLAEVTGQPVAEIEAGLEKAAADGAVVAARGNYMISPAGRALLDEAYPAAFTDIRASQEIADAMEAFETGVNKQVLALTTDWQTKEVGGDRVPNDHGDADYDAAIIDKLARVHEKTGKVLRPLAAADPLVDRFLDRIGGALTRAEGGETDYVSGVRVDSVHTVWFQMHEHLLRLTGRERPE